MQAAWKELVFAERARVRSADPIHGTARQKVGMGRVSKSDASLNQRLRLFLDRATQPLPGYLIID